MKTFFKSIVILLLLASVSACSKENTVSVNTDNPAAASAVDANKQEQTTEMKVTIQQGGPAKEVPYDYTAMSEAAIIQLVEDPRLVTPSSYSILLAPRTYSFMIFFHEPMQQKSVEQVLLQKTTELPRGVSEPAVSSLKFQWANEQQLLLTVDILQKKTYDLYSRGYRISVNGARTRADRPLELVPDMQVTLNTPQQIYRLSVDGQSLQPLTSFSNPYMIENLDEDGSYYLLKQPKRFCQCDGNYPGLSSVYDKSAQKIVPYPVELSTHYLGKGNFVADKRGFFYADTDSGSNLPDSPSAVKINRDGYIYGANFSRNHDMLIYAVGKAGVEKDPQIIIRNLATGSEQTIGTAQGAIPRSLADGTLEGVRFIDDGQNVYFVLRSGTDTGEYKEKRYLFSWQTKQLKPWNPPLPLGVWSGFTQSSDGMYQMYVNAGVYKGTEQVFDQMNVGEVWIPGTHLFTKKFVDDKLGSNPNALTQIKLYDADKREFRTIDTQLPDWTNVIGASPDGKWIYLSSMQPQPGSR